MAAPGRLNHNRLALGIDCGTSGLRAVLIDRQRAVLGQWRQHFPAPQRDGPCMQQDPHIWRRSLHQILHTIRQTGLSTRIQAIAIDATSATILACDAQGQPLAPALMYADQRAHVQAQQIAEALGPHHLCSHPGSGLAKIRWLAQHLPQARFCHQADWLLGQLSGHFDHSDTNNALKSGADPRTGQWPAVIQQWGLANKLPQVSAAGTVRHSVHQQAQQRWGLAADCLLLSSGTDSVAAYRATGALQAGDAVTTLGSTLVMKQISRQRIDAPGYGLYSQPLGPYWLVGGASNSGGAVLRHFFRDEELATLSRYIQADQDSGLNYYPLLAPGERFPICDPAYPGCLSPLPEQPVQLLHGLLEGMTRIEALAYRILRQQGAPELKQVYSSGGGAANPVWQAMRQRLLGVPVSRAQHDQAAYGSALLAAQAIGHTGHHRINSPAGSASPGV